MGRLARKLIHARENIIFLKRKKKKFFFKKNEFERKLIQAKISAKKVKYFVLFLFRNSMRLTQNISDFCGLFQ